MRTKTLWLIAMEAKALINMTKQYARFSAFYILFLIIFYLILRKASSALPQPDHRILLIMSSYFFHFMLLISILEGLVGTTRHIIRSDIDLVYSLPLSNIDFYLSRFLTELIAEISVFTPIIYTFLLALSPYLNIDYMDSAYITVVFLILFFFCETVRYTVDMIVTSLFTTIRESIRNLRIYIMAISGVLLILCIQSGILDTVFSEHLYRVFSALTNFVFIPSSASVLISLDIIEKNNVNWYLISILIFTAIISWLISILLAKNIFGYEFLVSRGHSSSGQILTKSAHLLLGGNRSITLIIKDLLLYLRTPMYHTQIITTFIIFLIFLSLIKNFSERFILNPDVAFFLSFVLDIFAVWFMFMPAAEFCLSIEHNSTDIIKTLPVDTVRHYVSRFIATLIINGIPSLLLVISINLMLNRGFYLLFGVTMGIIFILYSTAISILTNVLFPAYLGRFHTNPMATVAYIATFFAFIVFFVFTSTKFKGGIIAISSLSSWFLIITSIIAVKISLDRYPA